MNVVRRWVRVTFQFYLINVFLLCTLHSHPHCNVTHTHTPINVFCAHLHFGWKCERSVRVERSHVTACVCKRLRHNCSPVKEEMWSVSLLPVAELPSVTASSTSSLNFSCSFTSKWNLCLTNQQSGNTSQTLSGIFAHALFHFLVLSLVILSRFSVVHFRFVFVSQIIQSCHLWRWATARGISQPRRWKRKKTATTSPNPEYRWRSHDGPYQKWRVLPPRPHPLQRVCHPQLLSVAFLSMQIMELQHVRI